MKLFHSYKHQHCMCIVLYTGLKLKHKGTQVLLINALKVSTVFNYKSGLLMQQYCIRVTKCATQLYTQVWQIFNADQALRDDSTLVYNTCIVFQCCMPQLYSTLKNFSVCHKLNFRVSVCHQSAVWNCVVNACQTMYCTCSYTEY